MLKQVITAAALMIGAAGCASQAPSEPASTQAQASEQGPTSPELAAYAGSHQYPQTETARSDIRAAAIVNADQGVIKIYNFGTDAIRDADVWVNRAYVRHVSAIAPGSSATLRTANLYNAVGQQFSARGEHVNLVQIERDHALQTLMGPVAE
jgi:exo-beta-1,3-glucanase (GH17 family)